MAEILVNGKPWHYEATDYYEERELNHEDAKYLLTTLNKVMKCHGIVFMPIYGTLLGIIRENNFISKDQDMDCIIWGKDRQKMIDLIPELHELGIEFSRCSEPWVYTFDYKNASCDIDIINDAIWPYSIHYCKIEKQYVQKNFFEHTTHINFIGDDFIIPNNPEKILEYFYGKTWRVPGGRHARLQSKLLIHICLWRFIKRCFSYIKRHLFGK